MSSTERSDTVSLADIAAIIKRNLFWFSVIVLLTSGIAYLITKEIPRKYKSKSVLSIQSSYFRNPLVSQLISEVTDPGELNALKNALLRLSLSDTFLDRLGKDYKLYKRGPGSEPIEIQREKLLKRIEYFSLSSASFQVSVIGRSPQEAYDMTNEVLKEIKDTLVNERLSTLLRARDAISTQVQFLSRMLQSVSGGPIQGEYLEQELEKVDANIAALRAKYTEGHPEVSRLRRQAQAMRARLKGAEEKKPLVPTDELAKSFAMPGSKAPVQDIYNDLLKKLSYLNLVLEMENRDNKDEAPYVNIIEKPSLPQIPFFPDTRTFVLVGFVAGVVLGTIRGGYKELQRTSTLSADEGSRYLGVPLFGVLHPLIESKGTLLLDGPGARATDALPFPEAKGA